MDQQGMERARYSVIFISKLSGESEGYSEMAEQMVSLVAEQPGFVGVDSVRGEYGDGITVSYWESLEAIEAWRQQPQHLQAQRLGREQWYESFSVHVARLERSHSHQ